MPSLLEDEEGADLVKRWARAGRLDKLATVWEHGLHDLAVAGITAGRRIHLPSYSFARTDHGGWEPQAVAPDDGAIEPALPLWDGLAYDARWERQADARAPIAGVAENVLLLAAPGCDEAAAVAEMVLAADGCTVMRGTDRVPSDADGGDDGAVLVYLAASEGGDEAAFLDHLRQFGETGGRPRSLFVVTADRFDASKGGSAQRAAGIVGVARALAQSERRLRVRIVDVPAAELICVERASDLWGAILREPASPRGAVTRIEDGVRHHLTFRRLAMARSRCTPIRQGGTYLVVGGTGVLGKMVSQHLVETFSAKVIWIAYSPQGSRIVDAALRQADGWSGGRVEAYVSADVSDADALSAAVRKVHAQHGRLDGVFLSVMERGEDQPALDVDADDLALAMRAKGIGAENLVRALTEFGTDFLCAFSSVQAYDFLDASQTAAYAAAVCDADGRIAAARANAPFPIGIIHWGYIAASLEANGLADAIAPHFRGLEAGEAMAFLDGALSAMCDGRLEEAVCLACSDAVREALPCVADVLTTLPSTEAAFFDRFDPRAHVATAPTPDWRAINDMVPRITKAMLKPLGLFDENGIFDPDALQDRAGIDPRHRRWWSVLVEDILGGDGATMLDDGRVEITKLQPGEAEAAKRDWRAVCAAAKGDPELAPGLRLADRCLKALPQILTGKVRATDVVFPGGSLDLVAPTYGGTPWMDSLGEQLAAITSDLLSHVRDLNPRRHGLKVLEIGAGTGATTRHILDRLSASGDVADYLFTDVSEAFLAAARERWGARPGFRTAICDIQVGLAEQGIETAHFDLVVATNSLHATRDIRNALHNARAALHADGVILINEGILKTRILTLAFGLLDGWWLYDDGDVRIPGSPLINREGWLDVLAGAGFEATTVDGPGREVQTVFVGQNRAPVVTKWSPSTAEEPGPADPPSDPALAPAATPANLPPPADPQPAILLNGAGASVEARLIGATATALGYPNADISRRATFTDQGIDSILVVRFVNEVNRQLSIDLDRAAVFDHPTIERLASHIEEAYGEEIAAARLAHVPAVRPNPAADDGVSKLNGAARTLTAPVRGEAKGANGAYGARASTPHQPPSTDGLSVDRDALSVDQDGAPNEPKLPQPAPSAVETGGPGETEPIAIVGLAVKVPGADNDQTFWRNLLENRVSIGPLPAERCPPTKTVHGGVLDDDGLPAPERFDLTAAATEAMSPHQRLVLDSAWSALEDAAIDPNSLAGTNAAVYVGAEPSGWFAGVFSGASDAVVASRVSYALDLKGPALVVNTGCSSSAVAIHMGAEALRHRTTRLALVGGVSAGLGPPVFESLQDAAMLSDGNGCRTFAAGADGIVLSEAVGVLVLKRLSDALADGDPIRGVLAASGMNQDGASNGITAPNGLAQQALYREVWRAFAIDPSKIEHIEVHGTGTELGDAVEANALTKAFAEATDARGTVSVGSVKPLIGHAGAASGVVGAAKLVLAMEHGEMLSLPTADDPNPLIERDRSALLLSATGRPWPHRRDSQRLAALNSFGHSGTNVHLVLSDPPQRDVPPDDVREPQIVPLSATSDATLRETARALWMHLCRHRNALSLTSVAATCQLGRAALPHRVAFLASSLEDLVRSLEAFCGTAKVDGCTWRGTADPDADQDVLSPSASVADIAAGWATGGTLDWRLLWSGVEPQRARLPVTVLKPPPKSRSSQTALENSRGTTARPTPLSGEPRRSPVAPSVPMAQPAPVTKHPPNGAGFNKPAAKLSDAEDRRVIGQNQATGMAPTPTHPDAAARPVGQTPTTAPVDTASLLADRLSAHLGTPLPAGARMRTWHDLGLTSHLVVAFATDVAKTLGQDVRPSTLFELNTINRLASHLDANASATSEPDRAPDAVLDALERVRRGDLDEATASILLIAGPQG
ncbi:MAG: beta-ketoacyl synthase N-terminal-like domain-containing protein [Pseudomonadota bacterium]